MICFTHFPLLLLLHLINKNKSSFVRVFNLHNSTQQDTRLSINSSHAPQHCELYQEYATYASNAIDLS